MTNLIFKPLKLEKKNDAPPPGKTEPPKDIPKPPEKPADPSTPPEKEVDEFGYEKPAKPEDKKPSEKKVDPPKPPEKIEKPGTGYGEKPPEDVKPPEKPTDPPATPPTDLDKKLEGLHKPAQERVKKEIATLGLEGDKVDKLIEVRKADQAEAIKWQENQKTQQQQAVKAQRQEWDKELRNDPVFGGDKFEVNLNRAEKVLDEHFGELKKELTEQGQMLRPSVMRGLARLADQLYPDREIVQGDPVAPEKKEGDDKPNDPLAFYQ